MEFQTFVFLNCPNSLSHFLSLSTVFFHFLLSFVFLVSFDGQHPIILSSFVNRLFSRRIFKTKNRHSFLGDG